MGILFIGILIVSHNKVNAETNTKKMDFEIESVVSQYQVDKTKRFFDLALDPGKKEVLRMRIHNFSDKKITVHSDLRNAYTQMGGSINFDTKSADVSQDNTEGIIRDKAHVISKIGSVDKNSRVINLDPDESKVVTATIRMPEKRTRGMIYGSWHFIEYVKDTGKNRSSVSGNYAYNMAINLHGSPYKVYPELKYVKTEPIIKAGHPAMGIMLNNVEPMAINRAEVKAVIQKDGLFNSKRVFEASDRPIAPNSRLTIPISWGYDTMKPGKYMIKVAVKGQNLWNGLPMTWNFHETFTVKSKDVKSINAHSLKKPVNKWTYVATASGVLMLMSFAAVYKVIRVS